MPRFKVKGITNAEEKVFREEYDKWLHEINDSLTDYRDAMIEVMNETNLKTFNEEKDFIDIAKQAVFHKLICLYNQEGIMEEVNKILSQDTT